MYRSLLIVRELRDSPCPPFVMMLAFYISRGVLPYITCLVSTVYHGPFRWSWWLRLNDETRFRTWLVFGGSNWIGTLLPTALVYLEVVVGGKLWWSSWKVEGSGGFTDSSQWTAVVNGLTITHRANPDFLLDYHWTGPVQGCWRRPGDDR